NDECKDVPRGLAKHATAAFSRYIDRLPEPNRPTEEQARVLDVAFHVAGTGSLGMLRLAILVAGKGGKKGAWIFEMKEQMAPAAALLLGEADSSPGQRVVAGTRACLQLPPRLLGTTKLDGKSMVVRRLAPQDDKLKPTEITKKTILRIASYC